jgi:hypothetical protein
VDDVSIRDLAILNSKGATHVEMLIQCVVSIGSGWVRGTRQDVRVFAYDNNIRGVSTSRSFRMVPRDRSEVSLRSSLLLRSWSSRVDRSALERVDRRLDETGLVQRVGVDIDLDVILIPDGQRSIDTLWRTTPVFMQLETGRSGFDYVLESLTAGARIVSFTGERKVERDAVRRGHHSFDVEFGRGTGRRVGSSSRSSPASNQGRDTRRHGLGLCNQLSLTDGCLHERTCLFPEISADVVDVRINRSCRDDELLSGNDLEMTDI